MGRPRGSRFHRRNVSKFGGNRCCGIKCIHQSNGDRASCQPVFRNPEFSDNPRRAELDGSPGRELGDHRAYTSQGAAASGSPRDTFAFTGLSLNAGTNLSGPRLSAKPTSTPSFQARAQRLHNGDKLVGYPQRPTNRDRHVRAAHRRRPRTRWARTIRDRARGPRPHPSPPGADRRPTVLLKATHRSGDRAAGCQHPGA